ncbi:unnamed protein product [Alopecurus aequalis]
MNASIAKTKPQVKGTMKWLPHMSIFVLKYMASLIRTGVRTDKGFKEVHLHACTKALFEHCAAVVTSTQVYNHLGKWRLRWIQHDGGALGDDEIHTFSSMTEAVKEVAAAIRDNKPTDLHPDLYAVVMDVVGFTEEALMLALGHLVDHKAQGVNFVGMAEQHKTLWLRHFLGKYYKD